MSGEPSATPAGLPAVLIEAFADRACRGNGACVVLLDQPADEAWMLAVAASLKQSETAFLVRWRGEWRLRWFTPSCEVPLCGHATLAAILALAHWRRIGCDSTTPLHTLSGILPAICLKEPTAEAPGEANIELPAGELEASPAPALLERLLDEALGVKAERFWRSSLGYSVVLVPPQAPLATMPMLANRLDADLGRGLVVMQASQGPGSADAPPALASGPIGTPSLEAQADYRLRFFAPGLGIAEDPVTGSAHALVASWWQSELGRPRLVGWQCSDRPGGLVSEGASSGMIRLTGHGVLLWDGHLNTRPSDGVNWSGWPRPASVR